MQPTKNWLIALLLSIFLGYLGVDRFYLNKFSSGIAKLLLSFVGIGFIWWIIDIVLIGSRNIAGVWWDDEATSRS
jgi:TM2 domain-containing membrane protein YozV